MASVPVVFDPGAAHVFEPGKVALVRALAFVALAASAVAWSSQRACLPPERLVHRWRRLPPLALPALALLAATALSTVVSIAPAASLFGGAERMEGLVTTVAYVVLFLVAATLSPHARERLLTAVVWASLPVAGYALVQRFGLDPLPWTGVGETRRAASSLGNPILLGGYLAMVVPLTVARLVGRVGGAGHRAVGGEPRWRRLAGLGALVGIVAVQLAALVASGSRGPMLALLVALAWFVLLVAAAGGHRRVAGGIVLIVFAAMVASGVVLSGGGGLDLAETVRSTAGQRSAQVRVLIWRGAVELMTLREPLWSPVAGSDGLHVTRPLVGYGPESLEAAFDRVDPPELDRLEHRAASTDRAHNHTLDVLVHLGVVGLSAWLALLTGIVVLGLRALGLVTSPGELRALAACWAAGGVLVTAVVVAVAGWEYGGVALPAGLLTGAGVYVVARTFARRLSRSASPLPTPVVAGVVGALLAHWVDLQVGIPSAASATTFWVLTGGLAGLVTGPGSDPARAVGTGPGDRPARTVATGPVPTPVRTARQRTAEDGTTGDQALAPLGGIILGAFGSGFVRATGGLPPVVVPVGVACLAAMALTAGPRGRDVVRTVTVGGLWAAALVAPQAVLAHHAASGRLVAAVVGFPILLLLLVLAAFTVDGSTGSDRASTPARRPHRGSAVVAAVVAALAIAWLAMGPTIAEVLRSHRPTASDPGRRVARLAAVARWLPPQDHLQSDLARGRLVAATVAQDPDARLDQLRRARSALMRARSLSPYDAQHSLDLAALHRHAADLLVPGDRIHYLRRAVAHGTDAARLGPGLPHVRATVALAGFELADALQQDGAAGEAAAARRSASTELAAARALDPTFCLTHAVAARAAAGWQEAAGAAVRALQALSTCGEPFAATARDVGRDALREAAHAAQVEERMAQLVAFIESSATATATPDLHLALSHAHLEVGATRAAIAAAERALELTRPDDPATRAQRAEARALLHELQRSAGAT